MDTLVLCHTATKLSVRFYEIESMLIVKPGCCEFRPVLNGDYAARTHYEVSAGAEEAPTTAGCCWVEQTVGRRNQ